MSIRMSVSVMRWVALLGLAVGLSWVSQMTLAESLRDPTVAPVTESGSTSGTAPAAALVQPGGIAVLVRQGVPYLVVGTRLYAKGQKVGQARIERISETEVWLRENGAIRKLPVFGGIQRQISKPTSVSAGKSSSTPSVAQSKP
jgi:hypothetical protein